MPNLTIITPTRKELHASYVMSLLQAFGGMGSNANKTGYALSFRTLAGKSNVHHARSISASNWYDQAEDRDLMLFIDSDHTFSHEDLITAVNKQTQTDADIVCGVYINSAGTRPNVYPKDPQAFLDGKDDEIWYGGTGFMLISKKILTKVKNQLELELGRDRFWISDAEGERNVIPFFSSVFVDNELDPSNSVVTWLGEDYSFCYRARKAGGTLRAFLSRTIGHDTTQVKFFYPENYINYTWPDDTLVYYCGHSRLTFSPKSTDLGGSEQAVVALAKRFKKSGRWRDVLVYGNVVPGTYDGVQYRHFSEFDTGNKFGDIILWRAFGARELPKIKANRIFVDLHDNTDKALLPPEVINSRVNKVFVKSKFHASLFPGINEDRFSVVENGVYTNLFSPSKKRDSRSPYRFCWTSSYDRNLAENLSFVWPYIKEKIPQAELHIYYGDELLPQEYKNVLEPLMKLPGIVHHGRKPLSVIAEEKKRSTFHLYLTHTSSEIDCISVRESAAVGCIPIISNAAVFSERDGFHPGVTDATNRDQMSAAAEEIVNLALNPDRVSALRNELMESGTVFNWDTVAERWISTIFE